VSVRGPQPYTHAYTRDYTPRPVLGLQVGYVRGISTEVTATKAQKTAITINVATATSLTSREARLEPREHHAKPKQTKPDPALAKKVVG
jgi:hypothetical protein